jgi:hypothetical protein
MCLDEKFHHFEAGFYSAMPATFVGNTNGAVITFAGLPGSLWLRDWNFQRFQLHGGKEIKGSVVFSVRLQGSRLSFCCFYRPGQPYAGLRGIKTLSSLRYRGGVDTMLNAPSTDQDLFVAELSVAQSRIDQLLSLVQLYKALGGGWQE